MMGFDLPVFPERGQLTITEALPKIMNRTIGRYKQFDNGQVLLGVTNENVGEDTGDHHRNDFKPGAQSHQNSSGP